MSHGKANNKPTATRRYIPRNAGRHNSSVGSSGSSRDVLPVIQLDKSGPAPQYGQEKTL